MTVIHLKKKDVVKSKVRGVEMEFDHEKLATILGVPGANGICEYIKEVWEESKYTKPLEITRRFANDESIMAARRVKSGELKPFQRFVHFLVMKNVVPRIEVAAAALNGWCPSATCVAGEAATRWAAIRVHRGLDSFVLDEFAQVDAIKWHTSVGIALVTRAGWSLGAGRTRTGDMSSGFTGEQDSPSDKESWPSNMTNGQWLEIIQGQGPGGAGGEYATMVAIGVWGVWL
ncbi:hypothetical protein Dimus_032154 [Dionaea muscipula]